MKNCPHQKRVIINADDLGFSAGVTEGIIRAHLEGVVTSTTITANMPAAGLAVRRLSEAPKLGVGVHLNISQGEPISREGLALADADGVMRHTAAGIILACIRRRRLLKAVAAEFDAQIRWVLDHGIRPTHLDSHRHTHAFTPIFARVADLARRYDIPFVRQHGERLFRHSRGGWPICPPGQRRVSRLLNCFGRVNAVVAADLRGTRGTWGVAHTGLISAEWLLRAAEALGSQQGVTEIMTHPGLPDDLDPAATRLIDSRRAELAALCDPAVPKAFEENGIELIHYGHLLHSIHATR